METIIITGANSGIGYETAKHLALDGKRIIAVSRQKASTTEIIDELNALCIEKKSEGEVLFYPIDLMDLDSVNECATSIAKDFEKIDTLICNAGIMNGPYRMTKDGYESHFQTNYLGHFYFTLLLKKQLTQSTNPKVINVCSASAEKGKIDTVSGLEKISHISESEYNAMTSYRESKLAQEVSVIQMSRMPDFENIKLSLVHPGIVNTNLYYRNSSKTYKLIMKPFVYLGYAIGFFKTPKKGAQTSIYLAENNDYPSGKYWAKKKQIEPNPITQNSEYAKKMYDWSASQCKIN